MQVTPNGTLVGAYATSLQLRGRLIGDLHPAIDFNNPNAVQPVPERPGEDRRAMMNRCCVARALPTHNKPPLTYLGPPPFQRGKMSAPYARPQHLFRGTTHDGFAF